MKNVKVGQEVVVYDCYRFAIPVYGVVTEVSDINDAVHVQLTTTNNPCYPIGTTVWVSRRQLRRAAMTTDGYRKAPKEHAKSKDEHEHATYQTQVGRILAEVLELKVNADGRYITSWGTKTPLDLYLTVLRIMDNQEEK